jgi:hypothetical protein
MAETLDTRDGGTAVTRNSEHADDTLTLVSAIAQRVMGWEVAPDRFLLGGRRWMPRWRFQPTKNLEDAFLVLEQSKPEFYSMSGSNDKSFSVEVRIRGKVGEASNESKPLAIALAVARALGFEL